MLPEEGKALNEAFIVAMTEWTDITFPLEYAFVLEWSTGNTLLQIYRCSNHELVMCCLHT